MMSTLCPCPRPGCVGHILAWWTVGGFRDGIVARCTNCRVKGKVFVDIDEAHFDPSDKSRDLIEETP